MMIDTKDIHRIEDTYTIGYRLEGYDAYCYITEADTLNTTKGTIKNKNKIRRITGYDSIYRVFILYKGSYIGLRYFNNLEDARKYYFKLNYLQYTKYIGGF